MNKITPLIKNIIIVNVAIHLIKMVLGSYGELFNHFGAVHSIYADDFYIFQYFTYMWLHSDTDWMHLLFNMFGLYVFGSMVEQVWGGKKLLMYYVITGVGAGLIYGISDYIDKVDLKDKTETYLASPSPDNFSIFIMNQKISTASVRFDGVYTTLDAVSTDFYAHPNDIDYIEFTSAVVKQYDREVSNSSNMVGASGALFGILIAFGLMFPNLEMRLLFPPIPVKAKYLVMFYGGYNLYSEIFGAGSNVAYIAHLGGMLVGFIIFKFVWKEKGNYY